LPFGPFDETSRQLVFVFFGNTALDPTAQHLRFIAYGASRRRDDRPVRWHSAERNPPKTIKHAVLAITCRPFPEGLLAKETHTLEQVRELEDRHDR